VQILRFAEFQIPVLSTGEAPSAQALPPGMTAKFVRLIQKGRTMIERYTRKEMGSIFSLENKFAVWMEIEILACEALAAQGAVGVTREDAAWIRTHAAFDVQRIAEIEAVTNHDVIAFLTNVGEYVDADVLPDDPKPSRWLHYGMTSSDLGDTALCYQITQATDLILGAVRQLGATCKRRAFEFKDTICVGRTHGIHAEPMTFGMKFGAWAWALKRAEQRLEQARSLSTARGAISGAVGSYSSIDPGVEAYICGQLGLTPDPLSTQVIARDNHAHIAFALADCAATLEQIATEIRALQKSDTLEAEEPFARGQKGSSAMPHKRNPITCERVCGLARVIKANTQVALENVALWHERDISHSSAERVTLADSFIALDYILAKMQWILDGLIVYPQNCQANLERTRGLIYSSKVLLALVDSGITREEAYTIVQRNAMTVWDDIQQARPGRSYREQLEADPQAAALLTSQQLDAIFDPWNFLGNVGVLFERLQTLEF
jgi:adenylosuccinate lyase